MSDFTTGAGSGNGLDVAQTFVERIRRVRLDLESAPMSVPAQQGFNALTVFVGDEAFKTPLRLTDIPFFKREVAVHTHLQSRLRAPVPAITSVHLNQGNCFFGMKRLEGEEASLAITGALPPEQEALFASDIADVMNDIRRAFNARDIERLAIHRQVPPFTLADVSESLASEKVQGLLGPELFEAALKIRTRYAGLAPLAPPQAVVHGDLTTRNLLFHRKNGRLSGLLDFGAVTIRPIEYDLMRLTMSRRGLEQTIDRYRDGGGRAVEAQTVFTVRHAFIISALNTALTTVRGEEIGQRMLGILKREVLGDMDDVSRQPSRSDEHPSGARRPKGFDGVR